MLIYSGKAKFMLRHLLPLEKCQWLTLGELARIRELKEG